MINNSKQIIDRLQPIVNRLWYCPDCKLFLNNYDVKYAMGNPYCILHPYNDLTIEFKYAACVKLIENLIEELE